MGNVTKLPSPRFRQFRAMDDDRIAQYRRKALIA
jgi:hypothetical protein